MKRLVPVAVAVAVVIGIAIAVRNSGKDPSAVKKWRTVGPRLSGAEWGECCHAAEPLRTCKEPVADREAALDLLTVAHGECLDKAFAAVEKYAKDDLPAAYFIRAWRKNDPTDYLRALNAVEPANSAAARFNRALAQEKLGLIREAIQSWDAVIASDTSSWSAEARKRRDALLAVERGASPGLEKLPVAVQTRDRALVRRITRYHPAEVRRYFEQTNILDIESSRLLADALAENGDPYARAIVDAAERTTAREDLTRGAKAFLDKNYASAADLLERAGNPLYLVARYEVARASKERQLASLEEIVPVAKRNGYYTFTARIHLMRAFSLEGSGRYLEAQSAYQQALELPLSPTTRVAVLVRRAANYNTIGDAIRAFRDSYAALRLLPLVGDMDGRHQAYGNAAWAAGELGYPEIALLYRNAAVAVLNSAVTAALPNARHHLAIALRARANTYLELHDGNAAAKDLRDAAALIAALEPDTRRSLQMRLAEVRGEQALSNGNPAEAVKQFTEAIDLAPEEHSTYRAVLRYKRAMAQQSSPQAEADLATALAILQDESARLRRDTPRGDYEELWKPYSSRFQAMYQQMIERLTAQGDHRGAFLYAEQARAFEPMQLLLQSGPAPPGFQKIQSKSDLDRLLFDLPEDTLILKFFVLEGKTYTWALSRGSIVPFQRPIGRADIQRWVDRVHFAVLHEQDRDLRTAMRAAYDQLFRTPLAGSRHSRIVIIPDGPMHALPFAALQDAATERFVLEERSLAVAGSTSLYAYARSRDDQLSSMTGANVLIVGEPAVDRGLQRQYSLGPLSNALAEANQLHNDYTGSKLLLGAKATTENFLAAAKDATIIHFAGHAVANPHDPWLSMLVLAPQGKDAGDLTAEKLLKELPDLNARLIVLAACSTASGDAIGAEGLAPLVRPLIAARVPAVVGTLWDVKDTATIRELLVSFHRHYRDGHDVAVALQKAQLDMIRNNRPARAWAAFQAVGYAESPDAPRAAQKENHSELHRKDSLHRPDGLHPQ